MRLVIPAAGKGVRWRHYHDRRKNFEKAGFTKHFVEICGESIISRIVRLFSERGVDDIWVVAPDEDRYRLPGTQLFTPIQIPNHHDANKVLNSSELWEGRTIVLYGDVYLTENAVDSILADTRPWIAAGREGLHRWTGTPGELFGFVFDPDQFDKTRQLLYDIADMRNRGQLRRAAGWELYWAYGGDPRRGRQYPDIWLEIDDLTDDVDTPEQYEKLKGAVECSGPS